MEDLDELVDIESTQIEESVNEHETTEIVESAETTETAIIEYKEVDEPCVALTIIGENRLTDAAIFVKRSFRLSIKAFFSTIVLTIMNLFI